MTQILCFNIFLYLTFLISSEFNKFYVTKLSLQHIIKRFLLIAAITRHVSWVVLKLFVFVFILTLDKN